MGLYRESNIELKSHHTFGLIEAGCDEAGRGCLAGPVYAAAVILPANVSLPFLNDSKKLTEKERYRQRLLIEEKAMAWAVGSCSNEEIDRINILQASILAMHRAIDLLNVKPEHLIIDGNKFSKYQDVPFDCIVGGDGKYSSIAAASILAKTYRDDYMQQIHSEYPDYGWDQNKGYPTVKHRNVIKKIGASKYHRRSFKLFSTQIDIPFIAE